MNIFTKLLFLIIGHLFFDIPMPKKIILFLLVAIIFVLCEISPKFMQSLCYLGYILLLIYEPNLIAFLPLFIFELYLRYNVFSLTPLILWLFSDKNPYIIIFSMFAIYLANMETTHCQELKNTKIQLDNIKERLFKKEENLDFYTREKHNEIETAILNERNRIAREIHDSAGHTLSSCILQTEVLKLQNNNPNQMKVLDTLQQTLQTGMQEIRQSLHNLHDSSFDLKRSMEEILSTLPLQSSFDFASNSEMHYLMKLSVLSAFKEILANIAKHSNAKYVRVQLLEHKEYYSLSVKDDGNPPANSPKLSLGIGLHSIAEFSKNNGGNLNYGFEPDGFFVHLTFGKELS